jgi:hypothetical protein
VSDADFAPRKGCRAKADLRRTERRGGFRREVQPRRQHWFLKRKPGFPFRTPAFCSVSKGQRRLGEKEYRAPFSDAGGCTSCRKSGVLAKTGATKFLYLPFTGYKGRDSYAIKVCAIVQGRSGCSSLTYVVDVR